MDYSYPLSPDWTTDEVIQAVSFFEAIERAYEKGIRREELMDRYRKFKEIVPSMAEEKSILREFEESSGYAGYPVIKRMKSADDGQILKAPFK